MDTSDWLALIAIIVSIGTLFYTVGNNYFSKRSSSIRIRDLEAHEVSVLIRNLENATIRLSNRVEKGKNLSIPIQTMSDLIHSYMDDRIMNAPSNFRDNLDQLKNFKEHLERLEREVNTIFVRITQANEEIRLLREIRNPKDEILSRLMKLKTPAQNSLNTVIEQDSDLEEWIKEMDEIRQHFLIALQATVSNSKTEL